MRLPFLLLAAGLTMAAGPGRQNSAEVLPLPPIPPNMVATSEPAPVPNSIERAPTPLPVPRGPELSPTVIGPKYTYQGEAFLRGSTVQSQQNSKVRPAPGLNLTVPLQ